MNILVTGGFGFIGAALVRALAASGDKVRVYDNSFRGTQGRLESVDCEYVEGDIRDPHRLFDACEGCDEIIHLAFINGTENFYSMPGEVLDVGTRGMLNVLDACEVRGIKRLFLASSSEVYQSAAVVPTPEVVPLVIPDPYNARYSYAAGKIISEMLAIHSLAKFEHLIIVRPHNIYGPDMGEEHVIPQMARRIKRDGLLTFQGQEPPEVMNKGERPFWGAAQTRAFCYISDAINGFLIAREQGVSGQIYNVGTSEEVAIVQLARLIAAEAKSKLVIKSMDGAVVGDGGTQRRCPDMSKLEALGYRQTIPLAAGLKKTLEWYWR
jgi:UDP-glucose 4-epimerase